MEPEGILNGSPMNERITSTTSTTGKTEREISTTSGSLPLRFFAKTSLSTSRIAPMTRVAITRINPMFIAIVYPVSGIGRAGDGVSCPARP